MNENEIDESDLYIPVNVRKRKEIADGIGKPEVIKISISLAAGIAAGLIVGLILNKLFMLPAIAIFFGVSGYLLFKKDNQNKSMIDRLKNMHKFNSEPKSYVFKYLK